MIIHIFCKAFEVALYFILSTNYIVILRKLCKNMNYHKFNFLFWFLLSSVMISLPDVTPLPKCAWFLWGWWIRCLPVTQIIWHNFLVFLTLFQCLKKRLEKLEKYLPDFVCDWAISCMYLYFTILSKHGGILLQTSHPHRARRIGIIRLGWFKALLVTSEMKKSVSNHDGFVVRLEIHLLSFWMRLK